MQFLALSPSQEDSQQGGETPAETAPSSEEMRRRQVECMRKAFSLEGRPFFESVFQALSCEENDYLPLFALCLLYAIQQNAGKL